MSQKRLVYKEYKKTNKQKDNYYEKQANKVRRTESKPYLKHSEHM